MSHIKITLDSPERIFLVMQQSAGLKENIYLHPGSGINHINSVSRIPEFPEFQVNLPLSLSRAYDPVKDTNIAVLLPVSEVKAAELSQESLYSLQMGPYV